MLEMKAPVRKRWAKSGQAEIVFPAPRTWGGKRRGAGRKPKGVVALVAHQRRDEFDGSRATVHVTLKVLPVVGSLRRELLRKWIFDAIRAVDPKRLGVTDFSILADHLHLIVECEGAGALSRGVQSLKIRLAKAINRALRRSGTVFADRYNSRVLRSPTEMRNALLYVVGNERKHLSTYGATMANDWIDPFSSGAWFDGWRDPHPESIETRPVTMPRTWLRRSGWLRAGGRFRIYDTPGPAWRG
jgi:putative transposase